MKFALIMALAGGVALGESGLAAAEPRMAQAQPSQTQTTQSQTTPSQTSQPQTSQPQAALSPAPHEVHGVRVPGSIRSDVLSALLNAAPERVRSELGVPAVARTEGRGAFWTYQAPHCALYIFFKDRGGLHVSGAAAGPRQRGLAVPEIQACLSELEQPPVAAQP